MLEMVSSAILKRVMDKTEDLDDPGELYKGLRDRYLEVTGVHEEYDFDKLLGKISDGNTCIMVDGVPKAIVCHAQAYEQRNVSGAYHRIYYSRLKGRIHRVFAHKHKPAQTKNQKSQVQSGTIHPRNCIQDTCFSCTLKELPTHGLQKKPGKRLSQIRVDSIQESGQAWRSQSKMRLCLHSLLFLEQNVRIG